MSATHTGDAALVSRTYTKVSTQPRNHHKKDDNNLLDVWKNYLREWTKISNSGRSLEIGKAAQLLAASHPVPNELRSEIWFVTSGAKQLMAKQSTNHETTYSYLSNKQDTPYMNQINKDYERTFVTKDIPIIRHKIQKQLRRMLIGYANYNPDIGYAQGMNMVAAFILRQFLQHDAFFTTRSTPHKLYYGIHGEECPSKSALSSSIDTVDTLANSSCSSLLSECEHNEELVEEQAFWCFVCVMTNITTLFQKKLAGYHESVKCLVDVLKTHDYELWKHFDRMGIQTLFTGVFIKWFTSLFAYPTCHLNTTQKLWDIWLLHHFDYGVFVKFAYIMFQNHKQKLLRMNDVEIPVFCISSECIVTDQNWRLTLLQLKITPLILRRTGDAQSRGDHDEKWECSLMEGSAIQSLNIAHIRSLHRYGEYLLDIKCEDNNTWSIWMRYSQFERLYHKMKILGIEADGDCVFPAKSWLLASNNESLMRQRKSVLNNYMKQVLMNYNRINQVTKGDGALRILQEFVEYWSFYRP
eukprot:274849_1